jgi:hypothetical protein
MDETYLIGYGQSPVRLVSGKTLIWRADSHPDLRASCSGPGFYER